MLLNNAYRHLNDNFFKIFRFEFDNKRIQQKRFRNDFFIEFTF